MEDWERINAVDRMQKHILNNLDGELSLQELSRVAGYSLWHAMRLFKEMTDKTPFEYIRAVRLTAAAKALRDSEAKLVDIAMTGGFDSQDGFTRAFARQFGITPAKYRREKPPVSYFTCFPIRDYYLYLKKRENGAMKEAVSRTVTVQAVERPERRLIMLRSNKAQDYFSFCEEMGCDWEGVLSSIPERFDSAAILELPQHLVKAGTSMVAAGVEVPKDYAKPVPQGYEMLDLSPCTMLYFRGMPYDNEEDFCIAIDIALEAVACYQPEAFGYAFADEAAPRFNFGASAQMGAKMAIPVKATLHKKQM